MCKKQTHFNNKVSSEIKIIIMQQFAVIYKCTTLVTEHKAKINNCLLEK